jgi:DNA-binding beta-propeller fold protein YncE
MVNDTKASPGLFQYPNGIVYREGLIYVTDSNNRRVQVFDANGNFKQIIATQGLPRGIDFLRPFPGDRESTADRMVVVDTLSHDATIWTSKGEKVVAFGEQGVLDGQFSYPNGCAITEKNKVFIADTSTGVFVGDGPTSFHRFRFRSSAATGGCACCRCSCCRCSCWVGASGSSPPRTSSWRSSKPKSSIS